MAAAISLMYSHHMADITLTYAMLAQYEPIFYVNPVYCTELMLRATPSFHSPIQKACGAG